MKAYICIVCHGTRVPEGYKVSPRYWRHASRKQGLLCWWIRMLSGFPDKSVIVNRPPLPLAEVTIMPRAEEPTIPALVLRELDGKSIDEYLASLVEKFYTPIRLGDAVIQGV